MVSTALLEAAGVDVTSGDEEVAMIIARTEHFQRSEELRLAEATVLQRIGLLARTHKKATDDEPEAVRTWTRSRALAVTHGLMVLVRYPVHTATMYRQFSGRASSAPGRSLWRGGILGYAYEWLDGSNLGAIGFFVRSFLPANAEASSFLEMMASIALHYGVFGLMYGVFRQAVAVRILAAQGLPVPGLVDLARPALWWVRDRILLRAPRGSVFCVYVRDVLGSSIQASLGMAATRLLTSKAAIRAYAAIGRSRNKPPRIVFEHEPEVPSAVVATRGELLIYTQTVGSLLASVATHLLMYPVDALMMRLVADEAGLTSFGYAGFFDCLRRRGSLASLYEGFTQLAVAELSLAWLAAEVAHYLCKTAWIKL